MAVLLQQPQDHDLHQAADMQAVRRAVEADISADRTGFHQVAKRVPVGALKDEAARRGLGQEIGGLLAGGHARGTRAGVRARVVSGRKSGAD
jgi:hypothetical protein